MHLAVLMINVEQYLKGREGIISYCAEASSRDKQSIYYFSPLVGEVVDNDNRFLVGANHLKIYGAI